MKPYLLLICLGWFWGEGLAQVPTVHVRGIVVDEETLLPIPFATVILYQTTELNYLTLDTFKTKMKGNFHFDLDTSALGYKMLGNAPEYFANEIEVKKLGAKDTLVIDIKLKLDYVIPTPMPKREIRRLIRQEKRAIRDYFSRKEAKEKIRDFKQYLKDGKRKVRKHKREEKLKRNESKK